MALDKRIEKMLSNRGDQIQFAISNRNDCIRKAHHEGATLREIAKAVGLSHTAVARIVKQEEQK